MTVGDEYRIDLEKKKFVETDSGDIAVRTISDNSGGTSVVTTYNITLTSADTQYSQAIPANTKELRFRCRSIEDIRFAWITGKVAGPTAPYLSLSAGLEYFSDNNNLDTATLYLASAVAGVIIELECWV